MMALAKSAESAKVVVAVRRLEATTVTVVVEEVMLQARPRDNRCGGAVNEIKG